MSPEVGALLTGAGFVIFILNAYAGGRWYTWLLSLCWLIIALTPPYNPEFQLTTTITAFVFSSIWCAARWRQEHPENGR